MKAYRHTGVNPLVINGVEIPAGTERFEADLPPALENFLVQIEAIEVLPVTRPIKQRPASAEKE